MPRRQVIPVIDDADRLLRVRDVCQLLGVSDRWVRRHIAAGTFPKADFRFSVSLRWKRSTIRAWLDSQATVAPELKVTERPAAWRG